MPITPEQYNEMLVRLGDGKTRQIIPDDAVELEIDGLHTPIISWCRSQIPMVPYIHHHPYRKSGIQEGAPDFVIFFRGNVLLLECKSKTGKKSPAQIGWGVCAEHQGFTVHVIRTMREFHDLISSLSPGRIDQA